MILFLKLSPLERAPFSLKHGSDVKVILSANLIAVSTLHTHNVPPYYMTFVDLSISTGLKTLNTSRYIPRWMQQGGRGAAAVKVREGRLRYSRLRSVNGVSAAGDGLHPGEGPGRCSYPAGEAERARQRRGGLDRPVRSPQSQGAKHARGGACLARQGKEMCFNVGLFH